MWSIPRRCPPLSSRTLPFLLLGAALTVCGCGGSGSAPGGSGGHDGSNGTGGTSATPGSGGSGSGGAPDATGGSGGAPKGGGSGDSPGSGSGGATASSGGVNGSGGGEAASGGRGGQTSGSGGTASGGATAASGGSPASGGIGGAAGKSGGPGGNGGSPTLTGGAGASGCGGLICEDFEGGSVDPSKWDTVASGGTLALQTQQVAHGKYAARFHGLAGGSDDWAILVAKNVPAALKGPTTFGRAYVYFPAEGSSDLHIQFAFAGKNGTGTGTGPAPFSKLHYLEVGEYLGEWQLGFDLLDLSPTVEEVSYSKDHVPTNKWVCVEWQFEDNPDRVTVWLAGSQVATFDNTNVSYASPGPVPKAGGALYNGTSSNLIGGFDTFGFGFHDWHPQKAFDLYYDDVVLDTKRPGCLD